MASSHDTTTRNAMAELVIDLLEITGVFPTVDMLLYSAGGSLLVTLAMGNPAFQTPVNGNSIANPIGQALPVAAGTPAAYRIRGKDGVFRLFGSVGAPGSGADIEGVGDIEIGKPVLVQSYVYQAPP